MSKAMKYGFELNDAKVSKFSVGRSFSAGSLFFYGTGLVCLAVHQRSMAQVVCNNDNTRAIINYSVHTVLYARYV
jgi:hypothetical protein